MVSPVRFGPGFVEHRKKLKLTDNVFQTRISRDSLPVVTLPSFETLGEVHYGLDDISLKVKLVNAALRYHLTWEDPFSQTKKEQEQECALSLIFPCKTVVNSLDRSMVPWCAVLHISESTTAIS